VSGSAVWVDRSLVTLRISRVVTISPGVCQKFGLHEETIIVNDSHPAEEKGVKNELRPS